MGMFSIQDPQLLPQFEEENPFKKINIVTDGEEHKWFYKDPFG
jgi:hypothetical protein